MADSPSSPKTSGSSGIARLDSILHTSDSDERSKLLTNKQTNAKRLPRPSPSGRLPAAPRAEGGPYPEMELVLDIVALQAAEIKT